MPQKQKFSVWKLILLIILILIFFPNVRLMLMDKLEAVFNPASIQVEMPEDMANSVLLLRDGILDLGENFKTGYLMKGQFEAQKQLDGSSTIIQYGSSRLSGNTYYLTMDYYNGNKKESSAILELEYNYNNDATLLKSIKSNDFVTGSSFTIEDYGSKMVALMLVLSLAGLDNTITE